VEKARFPHGVWPDLFMRYDDLEILARDRTSRTYTNLH
jgi:hypothetical protein